MGTFPFGQPVCPCAPSGTGPRDLLVLGAYPSALHVQWTPPKGPGMRPVRALAVDNEPTPFWDGADEADRIAAWMTAVGWRDEWGIISAAKGLNGSSGAWVQESILGVLDADRSTAWITDCLDTYRASVGMHKVLAEVYAPFARFYGLPVAELEGHPSENQIVTEGIETHRGRLLDELSTARPEVVVTLGNAALRVFRSLLDAPVGPPKLSADDSYGTEFFVSVAGNPMRWLPMAHPAAPKPHQDCHQAWATHVNRTR